MFSPCPDSIIIVDSEELTVLSILKIHVPGLEGLQNVQELKDGVARNSVPVEATPGIGKEEKE